MVEKEVMGDEASTLMNQNTEIILLGIGLKAVKKLCTLILIEHSIRAVEQFKNVS